MTRSLSLPRLVVGNWKMNGTLAENKVLLQALSHAAFDSQACEVAVCVPFPYIVQATEGLATAANPIAVGAQDVSPQASGAYTGDVAADMLADVGCQWVIVGHSERRQYHHETDQLVAHKVTAAVAAGLKPIVCVGETLAQQQAGETLGVVASQLAPILALDQQVIQQVVIAYEPVWAIGTGHTATPQQAQEVHAAIRAGLPSELADRMRLLYGGSVNPENAQALFEMADIDGALVGGASLRADQFISIVTA